MGSEAVSLSEKDEGSPRCVVALGDRGLLQARLPVAWPPGLAEDGAAKGSSWALPGRAAGCVEHAGRLLPSRRFRVVSHTGLEPQEVHRWPRVSCPLSSTSSSPVGSVLGVTTGVLGGPTPDGSVLSPPVWWGEESRRQRAEGWAPAALL